MRRQGTSLFATPSDLTKDLRIKQFSPLKREVESNSLCRGIYHYWEKDRQAENTPLELSTATAYTECYEHIQPIGLKAPILVSQKGTVFTIQRINVILKEVKRKYRLHVGNFSCHSLRKTFGRQVYAMNDNNAELALVKLMELFNHSNVAITKRYLGLRQEEILQTYDCLSFWIIRRRHFLRRNLFIDPVQILSPLYYYQRKCYLKLSKS